MSAPSTDTLTRLLRAASAELARLFGPLLSRVRRFLATLKATALLPAHVARLSRIVLAGLRAVVGTAPGRSSSPLAGGGLLAAPPAPLPRLLRAVVRAAAGLVTPAEADKAAAWDAAQRWVDPKGHRLSARLWRNGEQLRARIDREIARGVRAGDTPAALYDRIEGLLIGTPESPGPGALRRLIVTEASRAEGWAILAQARRSGSLVRWRLSPLHVGADECDRNARGDSGHGAGVYAVDSVPGFPAHAFCRCRLVQQGGRA